MSETAPTPRRNLTRAAVPALIAAGLSGLGAFLLVALGGRAPTVAPDIPGCVLEGADVVGGPISLVDHNGARVTQADFAGAPMVLYFGFTHCPDTCPTSLYALAEAVEEPGGYDVQTALVSVDPERDTPEALNAYVHSSGFPPGLVGLAGSPAQVGAVARAFQVYVGREGAGGAADYQVDHSSMFYVLDSTWKTVAIMAASQHSDPANPESPMTPSRPADIAECIARGLDRHAG